MSFHYYVSLLLWPRSALHVHKLVTANESGGGSLKIGNAAETIFAVITARFASRNAREMRYFCLRQSSLKTLLFRINKKIFCFCFEQ